MVFIAFFEKSKSRKKVSTRDSTGQVLRPGEEVGGGVNLPFKDLRTSKPPIARRAGGIPDGGQPFVLFNDNLTSKGPSG